MQRGGGGGARIVIKQLATARRSAARRQVRGGYFPRGPWRAQQTLAIFLDVTSCNLFRVPLPCFVCHVYFVHDL